MKYFFMLLIFLSSIAFLRAEEEADDISQLEVSLSAECEPLTTIADCVNAQSGHFFQIDKDLMGGTIDPLPLMRYYDSGNKNETFLGYGFGSQFPLTASDMQDSTRHSYALISERDGVLIPYRGELHSTHTDKHKTCKIDPRLIEKGYTNLSRAEVSGISNFVNWRATHRPQEEKWAVQVGDKSQRIYGKKTTLSKHDRKKMGLPTSEVYYLSQEIKPNGNRLLFSYITRHGKPFLSKVQTRSRKGNVLLNELNFKHEDNKCQVTSSCGKKVSYTYQNTRENHKVLIKVDSSQKNIQAYDHYEHSRPYLTKVLGEGRLVVVLYDRDKRVSKLIEPLGPAKQMLESYTFHYGKDQTSVINPLMLHKHYLFDHKRVVRINYFATNVRDFFAYEVERGLVSCKQELLRQEFFEWSDRPGQEGWLKSKAVGLEGRLYHLKTFKYDRHGNVVSEAIYGNLTGRKAETFSHGHQGYMDRYSVHYKYSDDGRNLITEKSTPEGLTIQYGYLPETNLRTKELQIYGGKIQERLFRSFDDNGQISKVIQDDGSSEDEKDLKDVSFRLVKKIIAVQEKNIPSFGKPQKIIEMIGDPQTGQLQTLKTTAFEYDKNGNEIKQILYNSKNEFCYEITKAYDKRQRLIEISDPLGYVTVYRYDQNNNKIYEELKGSGKKTY